MKNQTSNPIPNFQAVSESNPCGSCAAYCCKMLLIPYKAPMTFMDLDYMKYMLGFPGIKMILYPDGNWQIKLEQTCSFLNDDNQCSIHDSVEQPKTCSFFNPYNCFYKHNFSENGTKDLLEINRETFMAIVELIQIDEHQNIVAIPNWDVMLKIPLNNK